MLCAKNLKVALAAIIGVVGLVGAGTAHATINLNPPKGDTSHSPPYFASEALYAAALTEVKTAMSFTEQTVKGAATSTFYVTVPDISIGLLGGERYYLRFELKLPTPRAGTDGDGASFDTTKLASINPTLSAKDDDGNYQVVTEVTTTPGPDQVEVDRFSYQDGNAAVVYVLRSGSTIAQGGGKIDWELSKDAIKALVKSPDEQSTYMLELSVWNSLTDAQAGPSATRTPLWKRSNSILFTKKTLSASVSAPQALTATVDSGFRQFKGADTTAKTQGKLATISVALQATSGTNPVLNHVDAMQIMLSDVLEEIRVTVEGDNGVDSYNFGEFYAGSACAGAAGKMTRTVTTGKASIANTNMLSGKITATEAGSFEFCANVSGNTSEPPQTKYSPIKPVMYTMGLGLKLKGVTALTGSVTGQDAGSIGRDGTQVRIGYLTTSTDFGETRTGVWAGWEGGSYNQRLVIVNHGSASAAYTLGEFVAEEGMSVMTKGSDWKGEVAGKSSKVLRVRDLLTITGEGSPRTGAILNIAATEGNVSVLTTQVTLPEGQTDTVRYHPR